MRYLFILLLWLPFVLLTDLFPLMRFGMFAEPVKSEQQTEFFAVFTRNNQQQDELLASTTYGIPLQTFNYLARNYVYLRKSELLLSKIANSKNIAPATTLILKKIVVKIPNNRKDTTHIASYTKP